MRSGIEIIADERQRQMCQLGWTNDHDDNETTGQLAQAAACYAVGEQIPVYRGVLGGGPGFDDAPRVHSLWPWEQEWWKPSPENRIRDLAKAGALIAAEIDRLQRQKPA